MFEDFASSGRGPGLVGILLAFLVLAGFSGMAIAVYYDDGSGGGPSLPAKVSANNVDIKLKKDSLVQMEEKLALYKDHQKLAMEVTSNERRIKQANEDLAALELKKVKALEDVAAQENAFVEYRNQYRIAERSSAVKEVIDLSETMGPEFKDVEILGITAVLLRVRTSSGPKGVEYQKLPLAIQDRFQFSEDEAAEFQGLLAKANQAKNKRIAAFQKVQDAKMEDRKAANRIAKIKRLGIDIEKETTMAAKKRDLSRDYAAKARQHIAADRSARSAGKMSMHKGLARQDEAKSKRYAGEANQHQLNADKMSRELEMLTAQ